MVALRRRYMDTVLQNYKQLVRTAVDTNTAVVLDNVYPKPVEYLFRLAQPTDNPEVLNAYLGAIQFWRELLPPPGVPQSTVLPPQSRGLIKNIFHPWEIYRQAMEGYAAFISVLAKQRRLGNLGEALETAAGIYAQCLYSLITETPQFRYSAEESHQYRRSIESFQEFVRHLAIKKPGHADDHGADETIIAAALFTARKRKEPVAIISHDTDLDEIVKEYNSWTNDHCLTVFIPPNLDRYIPQLTPSAWPEQRTEAIPVQDLLP